MTFYIGYKNKQLSFLHFFNSSTLKFHPRLPLESRLPVKGKKYYIGGPPSTWVYLGPLDQHIRKVTYDSLRARRWTGAERCVDQVDPDRLKWKAAPSM